LIDPGSYFLSADYADYIQEQGQQAGAEGGVCYFRTERFRVIKCVACTRCQEITDGEEGTIIGIEPVPDGGYFLKVRWDGSRLSPDFLPREIYSSRIPGRTVGFTIRHLSIKLLLALTLIVNMDSSAQSNLISRTANINGTSIYYEIKGTGFPIVFVSGGGILDRRGWDEQFDLFSKHYRVIRYDVRGIGKSARPQTPFSHSEDLYALLRHLRIARAHVMGLSVGGAIAIDFAIEHPELVDHLVLAASGLSSDSKSDANLQSLTAIADLARAKGVEHVVQLTLDTPFVLTKDNSAGREKVRRIYLDNRDVFESGFPIYTLWQPIQPPPENRLGSIRARVLIVRGDADNSAYVAMTDRISKGIPQATTVVIPGGTHFLNLEKPSEFNRIVLDFLNRP